MAAENHETRSKLSGMKSLQEKYSEMVARKDISENKVMDLEQKLQLEKHQKQLLLDKANELEAERKSREILSEKKNVESNAQSMTAEKPLEETSQKVSSIKKKGTKKKTSVASSKPSSLPSH